MAMNPLANFSAYAPDENRSSERWGGLRGGGAKRSPLRKGQPYDPGEVPKEVRQAAKFLHERAKRLASARRDREEGIGRLAADAVDLDVPKLLGYGTLDVYCAERLGIGVRTFRQHVWLERKMREMPEIREKLLAGEINLTKARAIAKAANPRNVGERIVEAKKTTTLETERKAQEQEDANNRKKGVRREWGPSEVMKTLRMAVHAVIVAAKTRGEGIDGGEAMGCIGEMMVDDHEEEVLCAVPGCRRPAKTWSPRSASATRAALSEPRRAARTAGALLRPEGGESGGGRSAAESPPECAFPDRLRGAVAEGCGGRRIRGWDVDWFAGGAGGRSRRTGERRIHGGDS